MSTPILNNPHPFEVFLQKRLGESLPGQVAQNRMRPHPTHLDKSTYKGHTIPDKDVRNSSVLVPIITWKEEPEVILTLRSAGIKHGGQLSFPGGGREGDETFEETALRETREEIGIIEEHVSIAGLLTPLYVDRSKNMVTPVVGFIDEEQEFCPNPNEVAEVFTVPFSELLNSANHNREHWDLRNQVFEVPFWSIHHVPLWGATAMMMSELLELFKEFQR